MFIKEQEQQQNVVKKGKKQKKQKQEIIFKGAACIYLKARADIGRVFNSETFRKPEKEGGYSHKQVFPDWRGLQQELPDGEWRLKETVVDRGYIYLIFESI